MEEEIVPASRAQKKRRRWVLQIIFPPYLSTTYISLAMPDWRELVAEKKQRQEASVPKDWIVTVPPPDVLNVLAFPEECGLLSTKEIEITNTNVDLLLQKLATGTWSSVEVTTAFYKRAIIAHQLVRSY